MTAPCGGYQFGNRERIAPITRGRRWSTIRHTESTRERPERYEDPNRRRQHMRRKRLEGTARAPTLDSENIISTIGSTYVGSEWHNNSISDLFPDAFSCSLTIIVEIINIHRVFRAVFTNSHPLPHSPDSKH